MPWLPPEKRKNGPRSTGSAEAARSTSRSISAWWCKPTSSTITCSRICSKKAATRCASPSARASSSDTMSRGSGGYRATGNNPALQEGKQPAITRAAHRFGFIRPGSEPGEYAPPTALREPGDAAFGEDPVVCHVPAHFPGIEQIGQRLRGDWLSDSRQPVHDPRAEQAHAAFVGQHLQTRGGILEMVQRSQK